MRHNDIDRQRRRLLAAAAAGCGASLISPAAALAADYPSRPITFICPWSVGGTADQSMRALCQAASEVLGQSIVVENRAGAAGMIGTKALATAAPDGYTIGQIPISVTRFSQLGMLDLDPRNGLTYLARTSGQTFGIAVLPDSRYRTLADVVEYARANPGKVTYGHSGVGGATHVGMEQFAMAADVRFNAIAYKGGAAALQDVLGGQVELLADSSSWAPHVQAGKLRLLATWGEERTPRFGDVPTLKELGYAVVVEAPNGVGAPKGLPPAVERRLREAMRAAVKSEVFTQAIARIDAPAMYLDGPQYRDYVAKVYDEETRLIESLGLRQMLQRG